MYKAETRGISVSVQPRFVEEESSPDSGRYFFAYTVEITNNGSEQVQLRSRHWRIVDGRGEMQEVRGAGVVGKQPVLGPGESFSYTSGCPLTTPDGTMEGTYTMATPDGRSFEAAIPAFSLDSPHVRRVMH
ncbi:MULTISPECIES: Co2+/Mg2+ efflux protein ApaG [unclassified Methylobacterium]|uniref:Co2+/Mg2+ efflux protein ApaG n=1 Tax=unclassified Methylobacterium TaxID=2615210 RepID=UPI0008EEEC4C|nr:MULTISPECIES: Co2+/Mg2+ efflux protein ApaG [unclassified Methylobacterium]AWN54861.1 Co2+/Mg2+ efflux protein ApaG [Methylobacterium sp. 17Sr1-1]SFU87908.1 ApaG protein [Methylobacterium sp. 174MFSha1.1]